MKNPEHHLLSVLQNEDMLRFVLLRDESGKLDILVEGTPVEANTGGMLSRLQLVIRALREAGLHFEIQEKISSPLRSNGKEMNHQRASQVVIGIRPQSVSLDDLSVGVLGFSLERPASDESLTLPAFSGFLGLKLFRSLSDFLIQNPSVRRLEVEYTRRELPADSLKLLERTLHSSNLGIREMESSPLRSFLSSWLLYQSGWSVAARAWIDDLTAKTALELIGRDIFSCNCEVVVGNPHRTARRGIDLSNCYPEGWPFPAILPQGQIFRKLSASRVHNLQLPELPKSGFQIGVADGESVLLPEGSKERHTYIVGATGTGKSTLLERMISEDMRRGEGVILLDPHGDLHRAVLDAVPDLRRKDLVVIDPSNGILGPGMNILGIPPSPLRHRRASFVVGELLRLFDEIWNMREAGGPMFELYLRNTLLLMILQESTPTELSPTDAETARVLTKIFGPAGIENTPDSQHKPLTLRDFSRVLVDKKYRDSLIERCPDTSVKEFWKEVAEKASGQSSLANIVPYIASKVNGLVQSGFVSKIICFERNDLQLGERMDRGEIILINLNKGTMGANESRLLGTILMMEIFSAGLGRSVQQKNQRHPVNVYVDEFQNFVSDNVCEMLSEARKFDLRLTFANQTLGQLKSAHGKQNLLETVLGNVGNMILFRLGVPDADRLKLFTEPFTQQEMQNLPNFHALVRLLTSEGPVQPVVMKTILGKSNKTE